MPSFVGVQRSTESHELSSARAHVLPVKLGNITATFAPRGLAFHGREQFKIFQNREIVIVVLSNDDLEAVATGANLVQLLGKRYARVRLDTSGARDACY